MSMQWKVRSTLSHSMHVLAQILGRGIAEEDLVVKFNTFIRDWDEVCVSCTVYATIRRLFRCGWAL